MITDLAVLIIALIVITLVLYGWGALVLLALGIGERTQPTTLIVWLGFCAVLSFVEIAHVLVPIDWRASLLATVVGATGAVLAKQSLSGWSFMCVWVHIKARPFLVFLGGIFVAVSCLRAMELPTLYDSGLYHFGSIRWLNEAPIALGLGNVHWRLALNQSYFGFLALLNFSPFWGKGYATGGLFLLLLTAVTLFEIARYQSNLWRIIFIGFLFPYLFLLSIGISNPTPDTAVALVEIALFLFAFGLFSSERLSRHQCEGLQVCILFLCFSVITIKLSSLAYSLVFASLIIVHRWRQRQPTPMFLHKLTIAVALLGTLHFLRSYLLSGAPLFPSPIGGLWSLPWAVQPGVASFESQLIYAWARQPGIASPALLQPSFGWLPAWFRSLPQTIVILFVLASVLTAINLTLFGKYRSFGQSGVKALYLPLIVSLGFWFFTAPDPRFLGAILVVYATFSIWFFLAYVEWLQQTNGKHPVIWVHVLPSLVVCIALAVLIKLGVLNINLNHGWPVLPQAELRIQSSLQGVEVFVPTEGAQCWNAPLPCAIGVHPGLQATSTSSFKYIDGTNTNRLMFSIRE